MILFYPDSENKYKNKRDIFGVLGTKVFIDTSLLFSKQYRYCDLKT